MYGIKIVKNEESGKIVFRWSYNDSANGFRFPSEKDLGIIKMGLSDQINGEIYGITKDNGNSISISGIERNAYGFYCFVRSTKKSKK